MKIIIFIFITVDEVAKFENIIFSNILFSHIFSHYKIKCHIENRDKTKIGVCILK